MPRVIATIDFKSSDCYLLYNQKGPGHSITADYSDADVVLVEWELERGDLSLPKTVTPITTKTHNHRIKNYQRLRELQGLLAPADVFADSARPTRALLAGIRLIRKLRNSDSHPDLLVYAGLAFDAYANQTVDVASFAVVETLVARACLIPVPTGEIAKILAENGGPDQALRAADILQTINVVQGRDHVMVPGFYVSKVCSFAYTGISMARYQLELAGAKPKRSNVVPDVTFLWSDVHRTVSPTAPGMPNGPTPSELVKTYNANSKSTRAYLRPNAALVDLYLDIKSPHAFLGVELARQLEADFDVEVRTLPFDMDIKRIHGEDRVISKPGSKLPPATSMNAEQAAKMEPLKFQRTPQQAANLKVGYADIRNLASLRKITVFGQEKVWDTRLANVAMLFTLKRGGRAAQDFFIDEAYEKTWKRQLNLEDPKALADIVARSMPQVHGAGERFLEYTNNGKGDEALDAVLKVAGYRGVWGIPSFYFDGEMYWGKEQVALIRKKLWEQGRALRRGVCVDVPYLWRPPLDNVSNKPSL